MKKMTNEEKVLQFLLNKNKDKNTNSVAISKTDLQSLDMTEQAVTHAICTLEADEMLIITAKSIHDDLSRFWEMSLKSAGIHYFENQQEQEKEKRNNWIQFWIPVALSAIAIIISIVALILEF